MTTFSRLACAALLLATIAFSTPLFAQVKKGAPAPAGGKIVHGVELRMVKKGKPVASETIEGYNSNTDYDAYVKFEYKKMAVGGKSPETVSDRKKLEPNKPATLVDGGAKFHILGVEIKDVELRTKML